MCRNGGEGERCSSKEEIVRKAFVEFIRCNRIKLASICSAKGLIRLKNFVVYNNTNTSRTRACDTVGAKKYRITKTKESIFYKTHSTQRFFILQQYEHKSEKDLCYCWNKEIQEKKIIKSLNRKDERGSLFKRSFVKDAHV